MNHVTLFSHIFNTTSESQGKNPLKWLPRACLSTASCLLGRKVPHCLLRGSCVHGPKPPHDHWPPGGSQRRWEVAHSSPPGGQPRAPRANSRSKVSWDELPQEPLIYESAERLPLSLVQPELPSMSLLALQPLARPGWVPLQCPSPFPVATASLGCPGSRLSRSGCFPAGPEQPQSAPILTWNHLNGKPVLQSASDWQWGCEWCLWEFI